MGETRVDLQHLLEDLRDAYAGALEETILTEVVANALDSGATCIRILTDSAAATLTIVDDGRGMQRRELSRYHDIAASSKKRGEGIGFAGVGIKLGLLVSREVITETRRGATHIATRWHLASRHRASWKWTPPPGLVSARGTAVQLILTNQLSPLLDAGYVEETLKQHFEPLLHWAFKEILRRTYPNGIAFEVDGRDLSLQREDAEHVPIEVKVGRRRSPSVVGYIERRARVPPEREGIAISTFGKVIKRGWEWLGLAPSAQGRFTGLLEAPDLSACLTLSKNDFLRSGAQGAVYLGYRKAIQEIVSHQLTVWGDRRDEDARPRIARLERDLVRVLEDLADEFPLLRSLVDRRAGGQKRLPMPGRGHERVPAALFADVGAAHQTPERPSAEADSAPIEGHESSAASLDESQPMPDVRIPPATDGETTSQRVAAGALDMVAGRRRPARYGLLVQFESRPDDEELARLVDNTIWINDAHPAYTRAVASRSLGYHTAVSVALALAPLAVELHDQHAFVTQFLAQWGATPGSASRPGRAGRRRPRP